MRDLEHTSLGPAGGIAPRATPELTNTHFAPSTNDAVRAQATTEQEMNTSVSSEKFNVQPSPPDAPVAIRVTAMPADTNPYGDIFGGWLVSQMDLAASAFASRHSGGRTVTAAIDAISFLRPVRVGDEVSVYASLLSVGRTSMSIAVEAWQRDRNSEDTQPVTKAKFTFVALDDNGRPRPVQFQ
ncbi:acyl-CoA thioesterase [Paraburkholderia tropica]|uniref:acyl-CoA thioesterase n=1 Tax=Paraburkholderia tropica TaxID=92647 RepID=UPI002AB69938|nr:acyl-CoA thioesterase [Paraburkholderia tropica]